ncbi:hypothetical protein ATCC90586_003647 [Pythium insidiosum]|nr:hypothetical protein ATCC90586_003647 [Pythium insidiosum]
MKFYLAIVSTLLLALSTDASSSAATCDADKIKAAMKACDSLANVSQVRCADKACHKALHVLVEDSTISCFEQLGLGKKEELRKYKALDDFCHGDGEDPLESGSHGHHHHDHAHSGSVDDHHDHDHDHKHGSDSHDHHHHDTNKTAPSTSITSPPAAGNVASKVPSPTSAANLVTLAPAGVALAFAINALA